MVFAGKLHEPAKSFLRLRLDPKLSRSANSHRRMLRHRLIKPGHPASDDVLNLIN
jgi:hypothetical protein